MKFSITKMVRNSLQILSKSLKFQSRYSTAFACGLQKLDVDPKEEVGVTKDEAELSLTCELQPFLLHELNVGPKEEVSVSKDEAVKYLTQMYTIRRMQLDAYNLYAEKRIRGFLHLSNGQEAICVGAKAALDPEDTVITGYRSHGWLYVMGASLAEILCELTGRNTGLSKGKGGSMHMFTNNYYGSTGIVGAQVPLGTGIAFAHKYNGKKSVSLTCYGDGASNQGQVFESFNLAKLWDLPVVFICENNLYGYATSIDRSSANTKYYTKGECIPGIKLNAMDVLAVKEAVRFAREYVSTNSTPIVLEFLTYRYYGHSMSDSGTSYRTREEISKVREYTDPITIFKNKVVTANLLEEEEVQEIEKEAKKLSAEAVAKAKTDKESELDELYYDLYANCLHNKIRHTVPWNSITHKLTRSTPPINIK